MYFYFSHIVNNVKLIKERNPIFSEAGKLRTLYLAMSLKCDITIISIGNPLNKGFFKEKGEKVNNRINIIYLSALNFLGLKYFYIIYNIVKFIVKNIRKTDKIIIYNAMPHHTIPIVIFKFLIKYELIYEIEELYSSYQYKGIKGKIVSISEKLVIKYCDKYIITNPNILKSINPLKPYILNRGYSTKSTEPRATINGNYKYIDEIPLILYSGRLDYEGGIEILLNSLNYISYKCEVVITGKGPLEEYVRMHSNSNPKVRYTFLGFVNNNEYMELLNSAKLCINPIRVECEFSRASFPSKIFQYLEYGNMVVSSDFQGIEKENEINNYIIYYKEDNPILLARAIDIGLKIDTDKNNISCEISDYLINQEKELFAFMNSTKTVKA